MTIDLDACFACGHCVASCPTGEMVNPKSPVQESIIPLPPPKTVANFLRAARTVRLYKDELVPRDSMLELIDIGRYPQTGNNTQGVSYIVIEGRDKIVALNELFMDEATRIAADTPSVAPLLNFVKRQRETGKDIVFRGCSQLILALADKNQGNGKSNAQFSLTFIALLAPAMNIGTCWAGIFESLATDDRYSEAFLKFASVPEGKAIRGAMMAGVPDIKYFRLAARNPLDLQWR
jgi:nitroreductase